MSTKSASIMHNRHLWFLITSFTMVIVISNWFSPRLVHICGLDMAAGTIIFPFTFLLSDLITEVYGYKHARRAIWCGLLCNFFFITFGQLVIHLPSPDYPTQNAMFDSLLKTNIRLIIASATAYLASEPLNSFVMAKLKIKTQGRLMGMRFVCSTVVASSVDSFLFCTLAFYNSMSNLNLLYLTLAMWFTKAAIEIIGLPISVRLAKKLKKIEQLDVYDKTTKFNIFSLEASYGNKDNEFFINSEIEKT